MRVRHTQPTLLLQKCSSGTSAQCTPASIHAHPAASLTLDGIREAGGEHVGVLIELDHQPLLLAHGFEGALVGNMCVVEEEVAFAAELHLDG